jgi:predicted NBD/HSP70 family sugar kinase
MYLAVDIGGTKTLLACFDKSGEIIEELKFPTPQDYNEFLKELKSRLVELKTKDFQAATVAVPGRLDRENGRALGYGTLSWGPEPIQADLEKIANCPFLIENDAKLAGLSEARLIKKEFKTVLYVTVGTGIGTAVIVGGTIDQGLADSEGGQIWVEHQGKHIQWEDLVSGKAIVKQFGKRARDISDPETWQKIARYLALGMVNLIAVIQPDVIVIGGGVGKYFTRFDNFLVSELKKYETPLVPTPPIKPAIRPEEAVIYGCYELAKARYGGTNGSNAG